jgi:hypothetical protein
MAIRQSSYRVLPRILAPRAPLVHQSAIVPSANPSPARILRHSAQVSLGLTFLILGIAFDLTLVLMPIGLPLALVGIALIVAPSDP